MRKILMALLLTTGAAQAEVPRVLADIAPVHALVAQVMGDLGAPDLLLDPQEDPHHFQMRPSQARQVADAEVIIWMGEAMTPWLGGVIGTVNGDVTSIELLELPDLPRLLTGDPEEEHAEEEHSAEDQADHDTHDHGNIDPHAWLDPENAKAFVAAIADSLAATDPENSATYHANAASVQARITALTAEISTQLAPMKPVTLLPYHDAYRYFFLQFDLQLRGALADSEATPPSARRLADLRDMLAKTPRFCVFNEPGGNLNLIKSVLPGNQPAERPIATLDPLGSTLIPGPGFYETLLRQLADAITACEPA